MTFLTGRLLSIVYQSDRKIMLEFESWYLIDSWYERLCVKHCEQTDDGRRLTMPFVRIRIVMNALVGRSWPHLLHVLVTV